MENSRLVTILKLRDHPLKLSDLIRTGRKLGMSQQQMSQLAEISFRSFKNRPRSYLLSFRISERVLLLQDLYRIGVDVFDSNETLFLDWLKTSIPALQNHIPNDLLTSSLGIDIVKEELLRIEHGVY